VSGITNGTLEWMMAIEQSDLDTIAQLVEEYVNHLAIGVKEAFDSINTRLNALEHVANQAIYRDYIKNEAVRVGFYVQGHPDDEADIPND
jgi:copper homeostasis protein CutC